MWFQDFLIGTLTFNFAALAEYAAKIRANLRVVVCACDEGGFDAGVAHVAQNGQDAPPARLDGDRW